MEYQWTEVQKLSSPMTKYADLRLLSDDLDLIQHSDLVQERITLRARHGKKGPVGTAFSPRSHEEDKKVKHRVGSG